MTQNTPSFASGVTRGKRTGSKREAREEILRQMEDIEKHGLPVRERGYINPRNVLDHNTR